QAPRGRADRRKRRGRGRELSRRRHRAGRHRRSRAGQPRGQWRRADPVAPRAAAWRAQGRKTAAHSLAHRRHHRSRGDPVVDARTRALVVEYAHRLAEREWVANHEGNVTLRLGPGRYLATPTATAKARVHADSLIVIDDDARVVTGRG